MHVAVDDPGGVVVTPPATTLAPEATVFGKHFPPAFVLAPRFPGSLVVVSLGPEPGPGTPGGSAACEGANPTAERPAEIADRTGAGTPPVAATATPPPKMMEARTAPLRVRIFPRVCLLGIATRGLAPRAAARRAATTWSSAASSPVEAGDRAARIRSAACW